MHRHHRAEHLALNDLGALRDADHHGGLVEKAQAVARLAADGHLRALLPRAIDEARDPIELFR